MYFLRNNVGIFVVYSYILGYLLDLRIKCLVVLFMELHNYVMKSGVMNIYTD